MILNARHQFQLNHIEFFIKVNIFRYKNLICFQQAGERQILSLQINNIFILPYFFTYKFNNLFIIFF